MDRKGFTLVELLAVIVILGIIMAFTYPNVMNLIEKNKNDNYEQLKRSIVNAAKAYVSDHRYEISVDDSSIKKIGVQEIEDNKILVEYLVNDGKLSLDKDGEIKDPRDKEMCLDRVGTYIIVTYDNIKKDFVFYDIDNGGKIVFQSCD